MTTIHRALYLAAAFLVGTVAPGAGLFQTEAQQGASAAIDAALAGTHRSEANKARDRYRHPKETLEFFGLRPEMTVVEI
jgi:predicted methyltransferase